MNSKKENKLKFFERDINYSACNEDTNSEYNQFNFCGNETVLCLLGGGERFFNLLTYDKQPSKFVLLDGNISELYLFEIKKVAYEMLDYYQFCEFLGLAKSKNRINIYMNLRENLSREAHKFWDENQKVIEKGLIYSGNFEKFLAIVGKSMKIFFGKKIKRLFQCHSLEEQREYFKNNIQGFKWNLLLKILCKKTWFQLLSGDPCFYLYEGIGNYYNFFKDRLEKAINNIEISENFLLSLILQGKYEFEDGILPRCYKREYYNIVKNRLKEIDINIQCDSLNEYLHKTDMKFDCYSLSDVCSYLNLNEVKAMFNGIIRTSNKGARIAIRELLTRYDFDSILRKEMIEDYFKRNKDLEKEMSEKDSSFIWNFFFYLVQV